MNALELLTLTIEEKYKGIWLTKKGEGERKLWWPNGKLWSHLNLKKGKAHGECKWWDADGILHAHKIYKNDKVIKKYC